MKHPRTPSRSGEFSSEPQPLAATDRVASEVLREASAEYQAGLDEARAWNRLRQAPSTRWRHAALGIAAAAAVILFVLLGLRSGRLSRAPEAAVAPAQAPTVQTVPSDDTKTAQVEEIVEATPAPRRLVRGRTRLSDGSVVHLHPASDAAVHAAKADRTTIDLTQGTVELQVAHQSAGRRLEVVSGVYSFVALGTAFRVSTASGQVDLEVSEGTVGVVAGGKTLAKVEAGKSWRGDRAAAPETAKGSSRASAPVNPRPPEPSAPALAAPPDCVVLAREGRTREAILCYEKQAEKSGMSGELAMYEIARLKRDVLSDFAGALDALRSYEARFPRGTLRGEVEVSILGLLQKLGRSDEALSESQRLLQTAWGQERAPAIRLLRGNIFRQSLHDCARAEPEYATLSDDPSASGDEAQFWRADCLERTGRRDLAARTYEAYLRRPHPRRGAEAKARLLALSR